ncbi:MAG: aminotransferase class I/II-fold pyridoxal phosphate-dependent enzyme, partial [Melioribacteraceae bacterium]|nr:aminotransferase class I/II-fold pyridoxal phosphate-dependent enzyme [Melioribacteraceae bacterium]
MPVSERITKVTASQTMKVAAKAKELRAQGENVIDLSVGEPDFPTPQNIKDAAIKAINDNQTRYTINSGTIELRQAIKEKLKNENNLDYDLSEISVNSGAKQSVYNALQAVVNAGDEVIIPAPYWVSYPEMVTLADGVSVVIDTSLETSFKITP